MSLERVSAVATSRHGRGLTVSELKDDNHQIPRSSSLIARRLPSSIKGRGNAQNYIVGTSAGESLTGDHRIESHARDAMLAKQNRAARGAGGMFGSMTKRFDGKEDKAQQPSVQVTTGNAEEDARIQAMFQQQEDQWEQDLDDMSQ
jgi:protein MPE1